MSQSLSLPHFCVILPQEIILEATNPLADLVSINSFCGCEEGKARRRFVLDDR